MSFGWLIGCIFLFFLLGGVLFFSHLKKINMRLHQNVMIKRHQHKDFYFTLRSQRRKWCSLDRQITQSILLRCINSLIKADGNFVSLTPSQPIEDSVFLQAWSTNEKDFIIEVCLFDSVSRYRYFRQAFQDIGQITQLFNNYYFQHSRPDVRYWLEVYERF